MDSGSPLVVKGVQAGSIALMIPNGKDLPSKPYDLYGNLQLVNLFILLLSLRVVL